MIDAHWWCPVSGGVQQKRWDSARIGEVDSPAAEMESLRSKQSGRGSTATTHGNTPLHPAAAHLL